MGKIKVLSENDIRKLINLDIVVKAVENAYKQKSNNKGNVWPLVLYEYEHDVFDLDIRSGNLIDSKAYGLKLISYNENNPNNGLPKVYGTALIFNGETGEPLALLNAAPITSYRTGVAAAIGAKYLARNNSKNLLVIGNGNIAKYSVAATLFLMPEIENVYVYNSRRILSTDELNLFKNEINKLLNDSGRELEANFNIVSDIKEITSNSDIIITTTPSYEKLIDDSWVSDGTHISCMGACIPDQQEIDENLFKRARIFADDINQCLKHGEAQKAYNKKIINTFDAEIGSVILGNIKGRINDSDITIFDSTGLFIQDLSTSLELIKESNKQKIGTEIEL